MNLDAVCSKSLLAEIFDGPLHGEGGVAGPERVVLKSQRRAEQRHDAVAHHLIDRAFVAVNCLHHAGEDSV